MKWQANSSHHPLLIERVLVSVGRISLKEEGNLETMEELPGPTLKYSPLHNYIVLQWISVASRLFLGIFYESYSFPY